MWQLGGDRESTVSFDGQPISEGSIVFDAANGRGQAAGGKIVDGKYKFSADAATFAGEKIVRVKAVRKTGRQVEAGPPAPPGTMVEEIVKYLPKIYDSRQSPLRCEVLASKTNQHNFELKSR
ncbi:MAG: hypothetical protein U9N87_13720 [Planctomycetota bacterium]|nr:hypothetical protein [Planctomycetota bacterium]